MAFVVGHSAQDCSVVLLVDPVQKDWPTGWEAGLPVVLVRTTAPQRVEALDAMLRGACGVLTADTVATALLPALLLATAGHLTVEAGTARDLLAAVRSTGALRLPDLTGRELDILRSIELGHTVRQTARTLGIAIKTVENTQSRLFRKLNARNRAGALVTAHGLGLLER